MTTQMHDNKPLILNDNKGIIVWLPCMTDDELVIDTGKGSGWTPHPNFS